MAQTRAGWRPKSDEDTPEYPDVGKCQHLLCDTRPCAALTQQLLGLDQHL